MILVCDCGEEQEFYKCEDGTRSTPCDETGEVVDSFSEFSPDGYVYYECAICGSEVDTVD
jgi:hypothetical protein